MAHHSMYMMYEGGCIKAVRPMMKVYLRRGLKAISSSSMTVLILSKNCTSGRVLPQLSSCHIPVSSKWFSGSETSCKERLDASEFFWELVTWGHSLLVPTVSFGLFIVNDRLPLSNWLKPFLSQSASWRVTGRHPMVCGCMVSRRKMCSYYIFWCNLLNLVSLVLFIWC